MKKKVVFGLKRMMYSTITEEVQTDGSVKITYAKPVAYPGAVKLEIDPQGEHAGIWADDMEWYGEDSNGGYKGKLMMAVQDDDFDKAVFGRQTDVKTGLVLESIDDKPKNIALLYETTADNGKVRRVLYNVAISRPKESSETNGEKGKNFDTPEYEFTAMPAKDTGVIKAKAESEATIFKTFFDNVPVKNAEVGAE